MRKAILTLGAAAAAVLAIGGAAPALASSGNTAAGTLTVKTVSPLHPDTHEVHWRLERRRSAQHGDNDE